MLKEQSFRLQESEHRHISVKEALEKKIADNESRYQQEINDLRTKFEESNRLHTLQLQDQERFLLAKGEDDVEARLKLWQERMQQQHAAFVAQFDLKEQNERARASLHIKAMSDKNDSLEAMLRDLRQRLDASQKEQNATASLTVIKEVSLRVNLLQHPPRFRL